MPLVMAVLELSMIRLAQSTPVVLEDREVRECMCLRNETMALQTLVMKYVIPSVHYCLDNTAQVILPRTDTLSALRGFFAALIGAQRAADTDDNTGTISWHQTNHKLPDDTQVRSIWVKKKT